MAMIQCEECGQWISDRAKACPNCGCPMSDYYAEGYDKEYGRIQARRDIVNETQERNRVLNRKWRREYIAISVVMTYLMYIIGNDLSRHHFGYAVLGMILWYVIVTFLSGVSFWKSVILHVAIPKLFGYEIITICSCIGYTIGFMKGVL